MPLNRDVDRFCFLTLAILKANKVFFLISFICVLNGIFEAMSGQHIVLIRYARACSTYDQFLIQGSLLTKKLMSQGFQQSCLYAAFSKFYGRYNDLIYQYLSLGHMLSDMFHTNR
jgi:hypothetical protein